MIVQGDQYSPIYALYFGTVVLSAAEGSNGVRFSSIRDLWTSHPRPRGRFDHPFFDPMKRSRLLETDRFGTPPEPGEAISA